MTALLSQLFLCAALVCGTLYFHAPSHPLLLLAACMLCAAAALLLERAPGSSRDSEADNALSRLTGAAARFAAWIARL